MPLTNTQRLTSRRYRLIRDCHLTRAQADRFLAEHPEPFTSQRREWAVVQFLEKERREAQRVSESRVARWTAQSQMRELIDLGRQRATMAIQHGEGIELLRQQNSLEARQLVHAEAMPHAIARVLTEWHFEDGREGGPSSVLVHTNTGEWWQLQELFDGQGVLGVVINGQGIPLMMCEGRRVYFGFPVLGTGNDSFAPRDGSLEEEEELEGGPVEEEPMDGEPSEEEPVEGEPVEGGPVEGHVEGEPVEGGDSVENNNERVEGEPQQSVGDGTVQLTAPAAHYGEDSSPEVTLLTDEMNELGIRDESADNTCEDTDGAVRLAL